MRLAALFLLLVVLVGCGSTPPETHTGWVRSINNYDREVTFEDEDLGVFRCAFSFDQSAPPLWPGMHARLTFSRDRFDNNVCLFIAVKHLPPDAGKQ